MEQRPKNQSETKTIVYMPQSLKDECERRASASNEEGYSVSKLVRTALREYFRRHPERAT